VSALPAGAREVFAAEFVRRLSLGQRSAEAAYGGRCAVECLRCAGDEGTLDDDTRAMVNDMLGVPR